MFLDLLQKLVSFRSISPYDAGAIDFCADFLEKLGFKVSLMPHQGVKNLYAKLGDCEKNLCFAGHVDVVPPLGTWSSDPFELKITNGKAYGRGVNDMKGPLASCFSAVSKAITQKLVPSDTSISFLLTSDEEIMGDDGTKSVIQQLRRENEEISLCVLTESCSPEASGKYIKVGCRGSLNVNLSSSALQCHVASAPFLGNHLHNFIQVLDKLCQTPLDSGSSDFEPSSLQITSLDSCSNLVRNIVPPSITALLNIRFNDNWSVKTLEEYLRKQTQGLDISFQEFGEAFVGCSKQTVAKLQKILGEGIEAGTKGGNSDALFIKDLAEVVEIGSPLSEAHIVDEFITIDDLAFLESTYLKIIQYFYQF